MNRDEARALFAGAKLDYSVLTPERVRRLRTLINSRMKSSGAMRGELRCRQRALIRSNYVEIRCKAAYFDSREAVTFNQDGFIGFAGWADSTNVQPIIDGFVDWVREIAP